MASPEAQAYFDTFGPEDQAAIKASWGGADMMDQWYKAAAAAGAVPGGGGASPGGSSYGPGWTPKNKAELQAYAKAQGWSEDFERFDEATVQNWLKHWDPAAGAFTSDKTTPDGKPVPGHFEKPPDLPEGWQPWGEFAIQGEAPGGGGAGGAGGGPGGPGGGGGAGAWGLPAGVPEFTAPTMEEVTSSPGFQFRVGEGQKALERSQAAKGVLRTGGSLKDLLGYGQDMASSEYDKVFGQKLAGWQGNLQPWTTGYQGDLSKWQTKYGGDLSKYLQKESQIYGLLSTPPPTWG